MSSNRVPLTVEQLGSDIEKLVRLNQAVCDQIPANTDEKEANQLPERVYMLAMNSDELLFMDAEELQNQDEAFRKNLAAHALDIRIFCIAGEIRWLRTSLAQPDFLHREKIDFAENGKKCVKEEDYWDESQFLDIDDDKTEEKRIFECTGKVFSTGGGCYSLPYPTYKNVKLIVRNYLTADPGIGSLTISDWRAVCLKDGGEA